MAQKLISFEVPMAVSGTLILVPDDLEPYIDATGGAGYMMGVGIKINPRKHLAIRTGMQIWNKPIKASYSSIFTDVYGNPVNVDVDENGSIRYSGFYAQILLDRRKLFFGGGFEFSIFNSYLGRLKAIDDMGNVVVHETQSVRSGLTEKFEQQLDLVLTFGAKIWVKETMALKPFIALGMPTLPLFRSGARNRLGNELNLSGAFGRAGIIFEFPLKGQVQQGKSKKNEPEVSPKEMKNIYELER